jgi:6-pyruvoyltetrahydropterin/6-carboxytetrahydropterin synthase
MYEISVEMHFDAAHFLRDYNGKCENLHGHRYTVVAKVRAEKPNKTGLAYDFTDLKKNLGEIIDRYDHHCLNEVTPYDKLNPSAENIAKTIYDELKEKLPKEKVTLTSVSAFETPHQGAEYRP